MVFLKISTVLSLVSHKKLSSRYLRKILQQKRNEKIYQLIVGACVLSKKMLLCHTQRRIVIADLPRPMTSLVFHC